MEKDPVDHLLLTLHNEYGWGDPYEKIKDPDKGKTHKYMEDMGMIDPTYYSRPSIESTDENCQFKVEDWPENLFDLLGKYVVKSFDEEGKIILYEKCINEVGLQYYDEIGHKSRKGRQFYINIVREIVQWHELGHWITHWMKGKDGHRWDSKSYDYNYATKDVHEGLAQAFTQYAIFNLEDIHLRNEYQQVFHYLLRNQAPCYHKHYDIINNSRFSWVRMMGGISMLRILDSHEEVNFEYLLKNMM